MNALYLLLATTWACCLGMNSKLQVGQQSLVPSGLSKLVTNIKEKLTRDPQVDIDKKTLELITDRMSEITKLDHNLLGKICRKETFYEACETHVMLYLNACAHNDCLTLAEEMHPKNKMEADVHLPNPYQLHAAYYVFGLFVKDYSNDGGTKRKLANYEVNNFYRIFMAGLVKKNLQFPAKVKNPARFMSRYLYMATIYFKTYITVEKMKAKAQNFSELARYMFAGRIRRTLTKIVTKTIKGSAKDINIRYIVDATEDFHKYLALQNPNYKTFAEAYAETALGTLVNTLGAIIIRGQRPFLEIAKDMITDILARMIPMPKNPLKSIKKRLLSRNSRSRYENFVRAAKALS